MQDGKSAMFLPRLQQDQKVMWAIVKIAFGCFNTAHMSTGLQAQSSLTHSLCSAHSLTHSLTQSIRKFHSGPRNGLDWIEQGLTSHQTHYRSYRGRVFTGQMTQPTVSKH